jgi:hypothetical protein
MRIRENDWVKYRSHEGYIAEGKVLEVRPDNKLVVGQHDKDPNPDTIKKEEVSSKIRK